MKIIRSLFISAFVVLILIQFYPNPLPKSDSNPDNIIPDGFANKDIAIILKTSCFDCHSNHVNYLWYSHVAPASWLISSDIREGRKKLNFSEWSHYTKQRQIRKLADIKDAIGDDMPLSNYTLIHQDAKLTDNQKALITKWCDNFSDKLLGSKR